MFEPFLSSLFAYQKTLREHKDRKIRNILKSRQIGATYYFSFEALEDAILTGDNQIFLSASKRQAEIFKTYICKMALQYFNVELKGNPIVLSNGAELHFLATNANTAQGNSGHVYGDEYAWIKDFDRFQMVSSAMATHKKWRETYFSTPSSKFHASFSFWSGDKWRSGDPKRQKVSFPSFEEMKKGVDCPDGQWRFVITIDEAIKGGANVLFDLDELQQKYSKYAFNQLYRCVWIDDADSIFTIKQLLKCSVDIAKWKDFDPSADRPFGFREVWGGYDPAHSDDAASFVIIAPPVTPSEKYRVLARFQWRGLAFKWQAEQIRQLMQKYNFSYIGVDATGVGYGVFEELQTFARRIVVPILYNPDVKTELVLKVHDLVEEHEKLEWANTETDIPACFLMVKQTTTKSGNKSTFIADRSASTQHSDVFWAIAHALHKKPLTSCKKRKSTWNI